MTLDMYERVMVTRDGKTATGTVTSISKVDGAISAVVVKTDEPWGTRPNGRVIEYVGFNSDLSGITKL